MYLAVYRLQVGGYIQETEKRIEDGRARIYMDITSAGQEYFEKLRVEYRNFITALEKLMMQDGALYPEETKDVRKRTANLFESCLIRPTLC